jgi:formiminotetrahydrofolate cyclodeaminase
MDSSFLKALAQARPDPGGGAAAAHSAALGMALLEKVVRLEQQRPEPNVTPEPFWGDLLGKVRQVASSLLRLQEEDVQAYFNLTQARAGGGPEELATAIQEAVACPLEIMQQAQEGLALLAEVGARCKPHLVSDLLVACELLASAFRGAHHIAMANLPLMPPDLKRAVWAEELFHTFAAIEAEFEQARADLLGRDPCR